MNHVLRISGITFLSIVAGVLSGLAARLFGANDYFTGVVIGAAVQLVFWNLELRLK